MVSSSPLRYPGGKTRFVKYILSVLNSIDEPIEVFAEPFCGGAGVSIALLEAGRVQRIAINDVDPLVANFWQIVFGRGRKSREDFDWLLNQIQTAEISLDEWRRLKNLVPTNRKEYAWKCLFLNRTSFNGIIHKAGPIGGWEQLNRKLDVRFNREKLTEKILRLSDYRTQVDRVDCVDWNRFCNRYSRVHNSYLYLDPPYYHRAEQLYGYLFDSKAHKKMRNFLARLQSPWLLSYDDAVEVRRLYQGLEGVDGRVLDQTYSTHPIGGASFVGRELVFSNRPLPQLPIHEESRPHIGLSVVGTLHMTHNVSDGPLRVPIATKLTVAESI